MASKRKWKKAVKKLQPMTIVLLILALAIGVGGGFLTGKRLMKNDTFTLLGQTEIVLDVGQDYSYREEGFTATAFGKDISDQVAVTTTLEKNADGTYKVDTSVPGVYGIFYTVSDSSFYEGIKRVRTIRVLVPEGGV